MPDDPSSPPQRPRLVPFPSPLAGETHEGIIRLLSQLLERARRGELEAVFCVAVEKRDWHYLGAGPMIFEDPQRVIGSVHASLSAYTMDVVMKGRVPVPPSPSSTGTDAAEEDDQS